MGQVLPGIARNCACSRDTRRFLTFPCSGSPSTVQVVRPSPGHLDCPLSRTATDRRSSFPAHRLKSRCSRKSATISPRSSTPGRRGRLLIYSVLVGIVAGLGAAVFYYGLLTFQAAVLGDIVGYVPPPAGTEGIAQPMQLPTKWWLLLIVPTLGGLVCGAIVFTFAPEAEGHGTDALVKAFHRLRGKIRARVPVVKTIASIITIGTGGSAGREGPIAQIGAGFGSFLADKLRLSDRDRRLADASRRRRWHRSDLSCAAGWCLFLSEVLYGSTAIETAAVIPMLHRVDHRLHRVHADIRNRAGHQYDCQD